MFSDDDISNISGIKKEVTTEEQKFLQNDFLYVKEYP